MSDLDTLKVELRRRAIAEDWTTTRTVVAEDLAETGREDGSHCLRSVKEQAERLGVGTATVKRHRRELVRDGVFTIRRQGGNGRGASVLDLTGRSAP
jgi:predicted ArsR family transcriptional regulator